AGAGYRRVAVAAGRLPAVGDVVRQAHTPHTPAPARAPGCSTTVRAGASRRGELAPIDDGTVDFTVREDRAVFVDGPHAAGHPMVVDRVGRVRGDFDGSADRAGAPVFDTHRRADSGPLGRHERR